MAKQKIKEVLKPITWQQADSMTAINPDLILQYTSISDIYEAYEKMEIDPYIFKNLMIAKSYPNKYGYTFEQGETSDLIYNYIKDKFTKNKPGYVDLQTIYNAAVNADYFGNAILQPLFENRDLKSLYDFKPKYFNYSNKGDLLLAATREVLETANGDNYSFIVIRNNQTDNNFYGTGIAQAIYYLRELRKSLAKTKQIVADKYGVTPWVALTEFTAEQQQEYKNTVAGASTVMESLRGGGFGIINGSNTKLLPLTNSLSINDIEAVDKEIGITITGLISGSTDSIDSQANGSQARATVQNEIVEIVQGRRLAMIEKAVNTLIRWMIDIRFGSDKPAPYFSFNTESKPQFADLITAYNSGIPIQRELLNPYIGDESGTMIVKAPDQTQPIQFAETSKKKILNLKI